MDRETFWIIGIAVFSVSLVFLAALADVQGELTAKQEYIAACLSTDWTEAQCELRWLELDRLANAARRGRSDDDAAAITNAMYWAGGIR